MRFEVIKGTIKGTAVIGEGKDGTYYVPEAYDAEALHILIAVMDDTGNRVGIRRISYHGSTMEQGEKDFETLKRLLGA